MRTTWFAGLETKAEMNAYVIRKIESTMGEIHTTSALKVDRIARALIGLEHAWNAKKPLLQTEAPGEISHLDCNIDSRKVESLLDFPLIERGPSCKECDCYNCNKLPNCHIQFPTTLHFCEKICGGTIGVANCDYGPKEIKRRAERIFRNEG